MNNYIDQQNDGNNLFMTKFKSVINSMNEALEGASSMADKNHDNHQEPGFPLVGLRDHVARNPRAPDAPVLMTTRTQPHIHASSYRSHRNP